MNDNQRNDTILQRHVTEFYATRDHISTEFNAGRLDLSSLAKLVENLQTEISNDVPSESGAQIEEQSELDLTSSYWDRIKTRKAAITTGVACIDDVLGGGFQPKRLVTLLGAPGSGKTSLANQIAYHVAGERPVLYVTSEDGPDILHAKTLARVGDIPYKVALTGTAEWGNKINRGLVEMQDRPSAYLLRYLDASSGILNMNDLRKRARAHFTGKPGPGLVVVDYLQRLARAVRGISGKMELRDAVTMLTEQLRAIACELDATVLCVASMNRASGYGKSTDALSSAKESGDIEYTSDIIMALTDDTKRPDQTGQQTRLLRIDKNRQGVTRCLTLSWTPDRQKFAGFAQDQEGR